MKRKPKSKLSFNTKYKEGDNLLCIKDYIWNDIILYSKDTIYKVSDIGYSKWAINKTQTIYHPFYRIDIGPYFFYSPNEEFIKEEISYGAQGMSGYGNINDYFCDIKEIK